jgi:hypothetical protein
MAHPLNARKTRATPYKPHFFPPGVPEHPHTELEIVLVRTELGILVHSSNQFFTKSRDALSMTSGPCQG